MIVVVLLAGGCAGNAGIPRITVGMDPEEVHRICVGSFPPAFPRAIRVLPDGTFEKVYVSDFGGVISLIIVRDKDGRVTEVEYESYGVASP